MSSQQPTATKRKIILDCDPGYDDGVAIVLACLSEKIDLLGVIGVDGNQNVDDTSKNAINLIDYLNRKDVPVAKGCRRPLICPSTYAEHVHGAKGYPGADVPDTTREFDPRHGVRMMIDILKENYEKNKDKVTVVTTGPMTDLAMAIRLDESIINYIDEVVFMGGSIGRGNVTPAAEFNMFADPEAAYIVFTSGVPIKMVGLDVTGQVLMTQEKLERIKKIGTKSSEFCYNCMVNYLDHLVKAFGGKEKPIHDPVTIAYLIDNNLLKFTKVYTEVDICKGKSYGRTNCDLTGYLKQNNNSEAGTEINVDLFWDILENVCKKY